MKIFSENDGRRIRESQNSFPGESGSENVSGNRFPVTALLLCIVYSMPHNAMTRFITKIDLRRNCCATPHTRCCTATELIMLFLDQDLS